MRSSLLLPAILLTCTPQPAQRVSVNYGVEVCYDDAFTDTEQLAILGAIHDWTMLLAPTITMRSRQVDGSTERAWAGCYVTILRVLSTMPIWHSIDKSPWMMTLAIHQHPHIWVLADRVEAKGDMRVVVAHELGHGFGLGEGDGVMSPVMLPNSKPECRHAVEAAWRMAQ